MCACDIWLATLHEWAPALHGSIALQTSTPGGPHFTHRDLGQGLEALYQELPRDDTRLKLRFFNADLRNVPETTACNST